MNERVKKISDQAKALPPDELAELVDDLIVRLHQTDPEIEKAWADEIEDRIAAHERGEMTSRPAVEVLAKYLKE